MAVSLRSIFGLASTFAGPTLLKHHRKRGDGVVLLYHRVADAADPAYPPLSPAEFRAHCEMIRENFLVLKLGELVHRLATGKSLAGCCAITFDDGYADFAEVAFPILKEFGFPVTHFLIADCVKTGRPTWNLRLRHVLHAKHPHDHARFDIERRRLLVELSRMPAEERFAWLEEAEAGAGTVLPYPSMLGPRHLASLDRDLVDWGSHTSTHSLLAYCDDAAARRELLDSREQLSEFTASPPGFLSYPNSSYTPHTLELARECGYEAAFAVGQATVSPTTSRFEIGRFDVGALPRSMLAAELAGLNNAIRRVLNGPPVTPAEKEDNM